MKYSLSIVIFNIFVKLRENWSVIITVSEGWRSRRRIYCPIWPTRLSSSSVVEVRFKVRFGFPSMYTDVLLGCNLSLFIFLWKIMSNVISINVSSCVSGTFLWKSTTRAEFLGLNILTYLTSILWSLYPVNVCRILFLQPKVDFFRTCPNIKWGKQGEGEEMRLSDHNIIAYLIHPT